MSQMPRDISAMLRQSRAAGNYKLYGPGEDAVYPTVEKLPLFFGEDREAFDSHMAIVNTRESRVITVASRGYEILDHSTVVEMADAAVEKAGYKEPQRKIYMVNGGDRMLVDYVLSDQTFEVRKGDELQPKVTFKNSYDLGWAAAVVGGVFRLVCLNGAYIGEAKGSKRKHTASLTPENMEKVLHRLVGDIPQIQNRLTEWTKKVIPAKTELNIGALGLTQAEKDTLLILRERASGLHVEVTQTERPAIDGGKDGEWVDVWKPAGDTTWYDVWNLLTEFNTHRVMNPIRRDTVSNAVNDLFRRGTVTIH